MCTLLIVLDRISLSVAQHGAAAADKREKNYMNNTATERGIRTQIKNEYRELQRKADAMVASEDDFERSIRAGQFKHQEGLIAGLEFALAIIEERS